LEEKCRDLRYEFFEKLRRCEKAKYTLTAHHLNDQIETFLFNLSRGANLAGFGGMAAYDARRHLLRPLLHLSKEQILKYLKTEHITYRLDKSNSDLKFSRNIIRREIVLEFEKINPNFLFTAGQTLHNLAENTEIIEDFCERWCKEHLHAKFIFSLEEFLQEIPPLQKKLLAFIYKKIHDKSLTSAQIKEIHSTLQKNRAGLQKEFGPLTLIAIVKSPKTQKRQVVIKPDLN
jgi:tRNA(Ile)-lysidine synthase